MQRGWVLAALVAAIGCGEPSTTNEAPAATTEVTTPFDAQFRAAADEFGVPYELLRATAAAQTGTHRVDPEHSHSGQAGVMGLGAGVLAEAARLAGVSEADAAHDDLANVRAAAALIADRRLRGDTWNGAALAVSGLEDATLRARWLGKYARHLKSVGELVPEEPETTALASAAAAPGQFPGSTFTPAYSGNYTNASRGTQDVNFVIIHDVEGSYEGCISWFQNPNANVSAHYVIANEGDVTQMVWEEDIAWHAGNWTYNQQSVGIEHEGYASDPNSYPETMYVSSAKLTRYLTDKYSIPRTRDYVIAHAQVPGSTHTDPGPYWQWDHYMELIESGGVAVKARLVGYVREGDIYEGPGIAGATVTLDIGRSATTDADGYYEIDDLDPGLYTVTATAPGYQSGNDEKEIESDGGTWWKSFALVPAPAGGDDDDDDEEGPPGARGARESAGACSVASGTIGRTGGSPLALALLALAGLVIARRRV